MSVEVERSLRKFIVMNSQDCKRCFELSEALNWGFGETSFKSLRRREYLRVTLTIWQAHC